MYEHYLFNTCSKCLRYYTDLDNNLPFKADTKMIGVNEPKEYTKNKIAN